MKLSRLDAEVFTYSCCEFYSDWTGIGVHYLPPHLAYLFGTVQYGSVPAPFCHQYQNPSASRHDITPVISSSLWHFDKGSDIVHKTCLFEVYPEYSQDFLSHVFWHLARLFIFIYPAGEIFVNKFRLNLPRRWPSLLGQSQSHIHDLCINI